MNKAFELWQWENEPSAETPLSAEFLNRLNNGLNEVDNRVINQNTTKLDVTTANTMVKDVTFDSASGIFTVIKLNGSTFNIDTKLEKLAVNFEFDSSTQTLNIILEDGTTQTVDLSTLITQYEFGESDTIVLTVGSNGKVVANIKFGSITGNMLEPNYLANVTTQADNARVSAETATAQADRATTEADRAEDAADRAEAIAGGDFATNTKVDAIIDGTTTVGNADKLDNHDSSYFAQATQLEIYKPTLYIGNTSDDLATIYNDLHTTANNAWYCARVQHGVSNYYSMPAYRYYVEGFASENYGYQIATTYNSTNKMLRYFRSISAGTWTDWVRITTEADLANYLPLNNGITNKLTFKIVDNGYGQITKNHSATVDYGTSLTDTNANNESVRFRIRTDTESMEFVNKSGDIKRVLHTGDKPSGTYTGNGDATRRTIEIGGIGTAVHIGNQLNFAMVFLNGYFGVLNREFVKGTDVYTSATGIVMETTSALFNTSGLTYTYQKL